MFEGRKKGGLTGRTARRTRAAMADEPTPFNEPRLAINRV